MPDILIRNVPKNVLEVLKKRASESKRSLQQELLVILERAALQDQSSAADKAAIIREALSGYGREYSDSTELIRKDRDR